MASASEDVLWSYLTQLAAALRAVHSVGLACRAAMHPSKLLVTTGDRLLIGAASPLKTGTHTRREVAGSVQL